MTKLISLAAPTFALVASALAASAENTFQLDRSRSTASSVALNDLRADEAGSVQVYAMEANGTASRFLGSARIEAGDNGDVAVALNQPSTARLQILMSNGNRAVSTLEVQEPLTN